MPKTLCCPSIPALFREQVAKLKSRPMVYGKRDGHWVPLTWGQMGERVEQTAAGLIALGVSAGEVIAILEQSGPEWILADLASLSIGALDVPIYETSPASQVAYILKDCAAKVLFVDQPAQLDKLREIYTQLTHLQIVVYADRMTKPKPIGPLRLISQGDLERLGAERGAAGQAEVQARVEALRPDSSMTLIYTSGTEGDPKGVHLSHGNLLANCEATGRAVPVGPSDVVLSFLPLAHAFERMAAYYMASLFAGATLYFSDSTTRIFREMAEVRPTLLTGVPRVYEKLYAGIHASFARASLPRRAVINYALSVGKQMASACEAGATPPRLLKAQYEQVSLRTFAPLRERLGGQLRFMVSGGAPLSPEVARFFFAIGVLILEGYGLSESSPVISVNRLSAFKFGTVGQPLDNLRLRFEQDGEILVQGPSVMQGYHNLQPGEACALRPDGWLATGDLGALDGDGFLTITGRKKAQFKTSTGKYVSPQRLERLLVALPFIEQAVVIGERRPHVVALLVPSNAVLQQWAKDNGLAAFTRASLLQHPRLHAHIRELIAPINQHLSEHEHIENFALLDEPFTPEEGLLTPSFKPRREQIIQRWQALINTLYQRPSDRF